ncbi:MAG: prepilin peptidase [Acidobacteria bacterium]|nr:prepilin peptidase [Acidobacteriota bacterium]
MFPFQDLPFIVQALIAMPFGLIIGSFLNVVIYRVPRGESVAFPASHCGSCGASVKPYDNIPLLSYAILRGRCRACKTGISWIYPLVELLTGCLFFAVVYVDGVSAIGLAKLFFVVVMIVLFFIDYRHQLLPNVITYPAFLLILIYASLGQAYPVGFGESPLFTTPLIYKILIGFVLLIIGAVAFYVVDVMDNVLFGKYLELDEEEEDAALRDVDEARLLRQHDRVIFTSMGFGAICAFVWAGVAYLNVSSQPVWVTNAFENLYDAALGAFVGGGIIWFLRAIYFYTRGFGGMGLGDVKMMAIIGGFLGWPAAVLVLIFGSIFGSIVGLSQVVLGGSQKGMKTKLPFGVFLGVGAVMALFFGDAIIHWYIGLMPH